MSLEAVALDVHQRRDVLRARTLDGLAYRVADDDHVVAVDLDARDAVRASLLVQRRDRRTSLHRRAHAEAVVDDHVHHRQLPQRGQVQRLVECADVGGRVAHLADDDVVLALAADRQSCAGGQRNLAADDGVAAHQPLLGAEQVHRAAPAVSYTALAAEQFGHDQLGLNAASDRVAVLAVVRKEVVRRPHAGRQTDASGFFTEIQVTVAADLGALIHLGRLFLETTDQEHQAVVANQLLGVSSRPGRHLLALARFRRGYQAVCGGRRACPRSAGAHTANRN